MRTATETAVLDAPADEVFAFLADGGNLPLWADRFARRLERRGELFRVENGLGEAWVRVESDPATRVIDFHVGPTPDALAPLPTRVVALPSGGSAYVFTMLQAPGQPDDVFESQRRSLAAELEGLRERFAA
jgi:hypothetical protein